MNNRLKAELWEIQVLLYWILAFLLLHFSDTTLAHILGWACVGWGVITFIGAIVILAKASIEDKKSSLPSPYKKPYMFRAKILNGKLSLGNSKDIFLEYLSVNEGKTLTMAPEKKGRSNSQNAYYWVYLGVIERETGNNADDLHEYFKRKLLPPVFKKVLNEEIRIPRSTTKLSKAEFGEYLDKICAMTGVPLPDPEAAGYISNYDKPYK